MAPEHVYPEILPPESVAIVLSAYGYGLEIEIEQLVEASDAETTPFNFHIFLGEDHQA